MKLDTVVDYIDLNFLDLNIFIEKNGKDVIFQIESLPKGEDQINEIFRVWYFTN